MPNDIINPNDERDVDAFHEMLVGYVTNDRSLESLLKTLSRKSFATLEQARKILDCEVS